MTLHRTDDHYNQTRYRYERDGCVINTRQPWQRMNYPFLFDMKAHGGIAFTGQMEHRNTWFLKGAATCLKS